MHLELAGEPISLQIWRADIGRTRLFLLDANVGTNNEGARSITDRLYGGDREHRIRQEVVLGVGGVRALRALGLAPTVFHMNEGHSAFLAIERLRELTASGTPLERALEEVRDSTVFTTHTPVPAGNEVFAPALVQRYLAGIVAGTGLDWDDFLALGRVTAADLFGLTPLGLRLAGRANGVSALHGSVAREMWQPLWPEKSIDDVPIGSVTNGVHARTWLAGDLAAHLGGDWSRIRELSDDELWRIHLSLKRDLLAVAESRGNPLTSGEDALTIGFARRFATYKRAGLLFSDPDRLARLLADTERPVQVLLAGKAHPADDGGKQLIREIWESMRDSRFEGRVVFLEDYQMTLARHLVQGVDVWLNTPRRPQEASGTSGMKAAMNGVVNLSILDGSVGRGLLVRGGLRDRRRAGGSERRGAGHARRGVTVRRARRRTHPRVLRTRRARAAAPLARADARVDRAARRRVQHEPHRARVRRHDVPPGASRAHRCRGIV